MNKLYYILSVFLFTAYVVNIIVGKLSVVFGDSNIPLGLSDPIAALLLFFSLVMLVTGIYKYENI